MTTTKKVMILGGYGTFGSRISTTLAQSNITVIIAGRNKSKAENLCNKIQKTHPKSNIEIAIFDVYVELQAAIKKHKPEIIVHTCGPFQSQSTLVVAQVCIENGVHIIDLADGRDFVQSMKKLDSLAKEKQVISITAASTVPGLSSAVIEHYVKDEKFKQFETVKYGITPGQRTDRGLATTKAVLSYIGKAIKPWKGQNKTKYGWQNLYIQKYPVIGRRLMGTCEVPDLDLLPDYFPIKNLQFSAGMESKTFHLLIWVISWLVRLKIPLNLPKHANFLLKTGRWFDFLGTHDGGMHVYMKGENDQGKEVEKTWYIIAENSDGPMIPTVPAVVMVHKILNNEFTKTGVHPCVGMISLDEYLKALEGLEVKTYEGFSLSK